MTEKQIHEKIKEFEDIFLEKNWQWRAGQIESITQILLCYYNKTHNVVILDCPTGGGKSIIGMTVSWILNQSNCDGYILTSDISLQEQYESDFEKYNITWGSVKGIDNYMCVDNLEKHSLGTCKIRRIKARTMNCYNDCPYFMARDHAAKTPTSLLNYAYWLIMQNYVNKISTNEIFSPRKFTICDEAHKILDIIQNHYSPRFDVKTLEKLEKLTNFFSLYKVSNNKNNFDSIKDCIEGLHKTENQEYIYELLKNIQSALKGYIPSITLLKDKIKKEYPKKDPPKEWKVAISLSEWLNDLYCKVDDYNTIIEETSVTNIIKNGQHEKELIFNCLEESYMMKQYFHKWSGFTVLMSATFADPSKYIKSIAINDAKYIKMDSTFNFEKSPIYFFGKRKMVFKEMQNNLPWLYKTIDDIFDMHPNERGIIHTASYDLTSKIYNNIDKKHRNRLLIYSGTEEKLQVLDLLKVNKDKVIIGPSLTHGLDLKDEWCRFLIFAKVPYLSLSDKFVAAKLKIDPEWYRWKACIEILQGVGRCIRHKDDWAVTYFLDGTLSDLIHYNKRSFPYKEFLSRIHKVE